MTTGQAGPPSFAAAAEKPRRTLISLTPLIDVVFILLVFFMLASSFQQWRTVRLDTAAGGSTSGAIVGSVLIDVRASDIRFGGLPTGLDALEHHVTERLQQAPEQRFLIRPAAGVPLQRAIDVMDILAAAGATRTAFQPAGEALP